MGHDSRAGRTNVFGACISWIAQAPGGGQRMASQLADSFFQIVEPIRGLGFPTPFNLACVDIDCPKRNRSGIDLHATGQSVLHSEHFPSPHVGIGKDHETGSHLLGCSQFIGLNILIADYRHLLIGRCLHQFGLINDQNSLFEQPRADALNGVGTGSPHHRSRVGSGKLGMIAVGGWYFDCRITPASGEKAGQRKTEQYLADTPWKSEAPRHGRNSLHRGS